MNMRRNAGARYRESQALLARAERVIPLGTQTFSKSFQQLPQGYAPLFLTHGKGGRVWDVDGNKYVDLISGLLPVVLGYCDPDVDAALHEQIGLGISFSLATTLEIDLAERLVEIVPCAEMARFGKNGSDATSAAVRVARAATGRDRIAVCGYHGWQDWYIGATVRNKGVPPAVRELTHRFPYDDLDALHGLLRAHPAEFAAVVLEPMNAAEPSPGYLEELCSLARREGAIVVFDEIVTGFRYALGGAQELFGVTPDLACLGKAMGNGMPIAAVVGRGDLMREFDEVFISGTFGGEALSLAAAIAVIDKMRREPVIETLWRTGEAIAEGVNAAVRSHGLEDVLTLTGLAPWKILVFQDSHGASKEAIRTLFMREMLARGVLIVGSHNVCYSHDAADCAQLLDAYDEVLAVVAAELAEGDIKARLGCEPVQPVFRVR